MLKRGNYDCSYIPLTSKSAKLQPQINIFSGNNNLFLPSLALCGSRFLKIKTSVFLVSNPFTFFKVDKTMLSKYGHLMLPGVFQDKITPVIDYADKAVVQCDVRVVKILFVGAGNLHMIAN